VIWVIFLDIFEVNLIIIYLDDEEEFFPLQGAKIKTFAPSMNSSMTSSMSSVASR